MEPATGASTWAFGSHRWVRNIGIFTRKAIIVANHQIWSPAGEKRGAAIGRSRERCPFKEAIKRSLSRRGSEAVTV